MVNVAHRNLKEFNNYINSIQIQHTQSNVFVKVKIINNINNTFPVKNKLFNFKIQVF